MSDSSRRYTAEFRARAVRMFEEARPDYRSDTAAMVKVAELLGVNGGETIRRWVRQAQIDSGTRPGVTTEESSELRRLKRENLELKRANSILKTAASFFAAELDRPGL